MNRETMTDRELYGLMLKWGKLKGTIEQPLFSDRHFVRELRNTQSENKYMKDEVKENG